MKQKRKRWKGFLEPNFQHRYVSGAEAPLKPGTYKVISDWYFVPRSPRIGETCTAYIEHAKQAGKLLKTTIAALTVESDD